MSGESRVRKVAPLRPQLLGQAEARREEIAAWMRSRAAFFVLVSQAAAKLGLKDPSQHTRPSCIRGRTDDGDVIRVSATWFIDKATTKGYRVDFFRNRTEITAWTGGRNIRITVVALSEVQFVRDFRHVCVNSGLVEPEGGQD